MSEQQTFSPTEQQHLRKIAGILGVIQSLAWIIMSLTCIVLYVQGPDRPHVDSYMGQIRYLMYTFFLDREQEPFRKQAFRPSVFFSFMWAYMFIDAAWLICSLLFLTKKRDPQQIPSDIKTWASVTYVVCLLDILTVVILGVDYHNCLRVRSVSEVLKQQACANSILPVLVIAAKGFVLWVVNLVFARVIHKIYQQMKNKQIQQEQQLTNNGGNVPAAPHPETFYYPQTLYPPSPPSYASVVSGQRQNVTAPPYFPPQRQMVDVPQNQ